MKFADFFKSEIGSKVFTGSIVIIVLSSIAALYDTPYTMFISKATILFLVTYLSIGALFFRK